MVLIRFDAVSHRFLNGDYGIKDVSLSINDGDFVVLAGRNGSGKTVLMKHANGLLEPTEGKVYFRNKPVSAGPSEVKRQVGLVFQNPDVQLVCPTVREELAFGPENLGIPRDEIEKRIEKAVETLDLRELAEKRTSALSGGEKRKIAIAGILTMEPELLILDEPFTGLDFPGIREVIATLLRVHKTGRTVIVITHEIEKVLAHANRLVIMEDGSIVRDGTPGDLIGLVENYGIKNPLQAYRNWRDLTWKE